jgi:hypothetical protein
VKIRSILATREALKQLRYKLNDRAFGMLDREGYIYTARVQAGGVTTC